MKLKYIISHAWVLDGFLRTNFNNTTRNYIWANLCWNGSYDGLYLIENNNLTFEVSADRHYNSNFSIYIQMFVICNYLT
jgi:hypothetical protein